MRRHERVRRHLALTVLALVAVLTMGFGPKDSLLVFVDETQLELMKEHAINGVRVKPATSATIR